MWSVLTNPVPAGRRYRLLRDEAPVSNREFLAALESDADFARWYTGMLLTCQYSACYWEHPPLVTNALDEEYEFVLIEAPLLLRMRPDPTPFGQQFDRRPDSDVVSFPNLGGDAMLVVPRPPTPGSAFPHLLAFLSNATDDQVCALWQETARTARGAIDNTPVWLSTAGLGVAWLHIRIDTRPKYYSHAPYKSFV